MSSNITHMNSSRAGRIAAELRAERERAGLTQAQLAGMADCSLSMLALIEGGAAPRRSPTLERIRVVLAQQLAARSAPK